MERGGRVLLAGICLLAVALVCPSSLPAQQAWGDVAVREGIALHDRGEYDKAIEKFEEALARNPADMVALYEMANTYFAKKDYRKVLELGERGIATKSPLRASFHMVIGNARDSLGDADGAIKAYKAGIRDDRNHSGLHYNLAVAYLGKNKLEDARKELREDLLLAPDHPSGHYVMARWYQVHGYRAPALLAYCRFLTLEGASPRAKDALANIERLLAQGHSESVGADGKPHVNVTLDVNGKKDEGDFASVDLVMAISGVSEVQERVKEGENRTASTIATVLSVVAGLEKGKGSKGFAMRYYVPFISALGERKLIGPFAQAIVVAGGGMPDAQAWLSANREAMQALTECLKTHEWPRR